MDTQKLEWEKSYRKLDNFVFYPHEEVIRFVSKNIRKRVGLGEFRDVVSCATQAKVLDLGCGIGRHVIYCHDMGLDAYGVDLSQYAVDRAVEWAKIRGVAHADEKIVQGDIRKLPWKDGYFDFAVSHGVLDSMHFEIARAACQELRRVMKEGGLFYCDLVSGDDSGHAREYCGEELVENLHEQGTVQSYFNIGKIQELFYGFFEIDEALLVRRENVLAGGYSSRHHLALRSI